MACTKPTLTQPPELPALRSAPSNFNERQEASLTYQSLYWFTDANAVIDYAECIRDQIAATALAGDLPDLTGQAGQSFVVNQAEDSVAFAPANKPKNLIINGGFDIWQRDTTQTSTGYGSDDRWVNENFGSTKVHSRQDFELGQADVLGEPHYFSRTAVTSVAGASNFVAKSQRIESVRTAAGETVTVSFEGRANTPMAMGVELSQSFGTGGTPSADVNIAPQVVNLTTSWQAFRLTFSIPSIAGKIVGSDKNDYLILAFWFDSGSTYDARSGIGQQSGTFDIAKVSFNIGDTTPLSDPFENRSIGEELALCQRFYQKSYNLDVVPGQENDNGIVYSQRHPTTSTYTPVSLKIRMRAVPSVTTYSGGPISYAGNVYAGTSGTYVVATIFRTGETAFMVEALTPSVQSPIEFHYTVEAEL